MAERFHSFREFWPYYLGEHAKPSTRALHMAGTVLGALIAIVALGSRHFWLLPVALVASYGVAWASHFGIEKNRPATFTYPVWSFFGDWKMLGLALTGRLAAELERLHIGGHSGQATAP